MNKYDYKNICPFKWFVLENFPFIEDDFDALTNWQLFCKIGKEINKIIASQNNVGQAVEDFTEKFIVLYNYVHDYFDNLDVQEEINNKLDVMAQDGTLENILLHYVNCARVYETTVDMIADAENLVDGQKVNTLGYYNVGDKGASNFIITDTENSNVYQIDLENGLYATLITTDSVNIKQFGAVEDGTTDDLTAFQNAISCLTKNNIKNLVLNNKDYLLSAKITFNGISIMGNNATIKFNASASADSYPIHCTGNNFIIKDLNIDLGNSSYLAASMRLQNCNNVKILNGYYSHAIDIYSNNKNIIVSNIFNGMGLTCRELFTHTTENITFVNCSVDRPENPDECCWVVSSNGTIKNVKFLNCNFKHRGGASNYLSISAYYSGSITENVVFENCDFDLKATGYRCLHFNASLTPATKGITRNVYFDKCKFNIDCVSENNRYVAQNDIEDDSVIFNDCYFNIINSYYYGFINCVLKNSKILIDSNVYCFNKCKLDNCDVTASSCQYLSVGACDIKNSKITNAGLINIINMNQYGSKNKTLIDNCDITASGDALFQVNSNTGHMTIKNSKITNSNSGDIFTANSVTDICYMTLQNVNLSSGYSKLANYNTNIEINVKNLMINDKPIPILINDIDANSRRAMALNTIIMAPIDIGFCYRKTATGNLPSAWALIEPVV